MKSKPVIRVLFVCRGSTTNGLGHVMRSRAVASVAARQMSVRMAVIGDNYVESLLSDSGLDYQIFPDETGVLQLMQKIRPNILVFDALTVPDSTIQAARASQATLVSLSPVCDKLAEMDLLFHRTEYWGDWDFVRNGGPEIRCGLQYTVVRDNCLQIAEETYKQSLQQNPLAVCVSMGGADAGNKTLKTLQALRCVRSPLLIWALLGEGYTHSYEDLVQCVQKDSRHEIILAKTCNSMWRVMKTCCLAILAGGTVTYESTFAGLPSINLFESENHMFLIRELVEKGIALSAGYPVDDALDVAVANISHLEQNRDTLLKMHQSARGTVDNLGCERIVNELSEFYWDRQVGRRRSTSHQPTSLPLAG